MHLNAYLSRSRHGLFYFRWPLPKQPNQDKRSSLRLSLRTRCPKLAGQLARHLASCGDALRNGKGQPNVRHDELRALIHKYFKKVLAQKLDQLGARGPMSELELAPYRRSLRRQARISGASSTQMAPKPSCANSVRLPAFRRPKPPTIQQGYNESTNWPSAICTRLGTNIELRWTHTNTRRPQA